MKRKYLRFVTSLIGFVLILGLIGCSNESNSSEDNANENADSSSSEERMKIDVMVTAFSPEPFNEDSPALQKIEEYTNTDLNIDFVPDANYEDRFNVTLASQDLPHIMVAFKNPSFINAARDGAFWDLTDYLDDYENLSQANEIALSNASIDGRHYGIYRARDLGRLAVTINKKWLDNLGLEIPKTIDEYYEVLKAFTHDDPDQNGQNDTYGMVVSEYPGPWDIMQVWFGAPNLWGLDENGKFLPDFMFEEYREALNFFKKIYDEGLVNEDFAVMDSGQWLDPMVSEKAGVIVDVADQAQKIQNRMVENYTDEDIVLDIFGAVEGPAGYRNKPTAGYHGVLAISTTAVKTEEELRRVLQFLDDLNDEEMQNVTENGIEGIHYELDENGDVVSDDTTLFNKEVWDLVQMQMFIPERRYRTPAQTALLQKEQEVLKDNLDYLVANPAEPLLSPTYTERGTQLDNIIADARIQYIVGQIDSAGLDEAVELWKRSGGEEYIQEINEAYEAAQE